MKFLWKEMFGWESFLFNWIIDAQWVSTKRPCILLCCPAMTFKLPFHGFLSISLGKIDSRFHFEMENVSDRQSVFSSFPNTSENVFPFVIIFLLGPLWRYVLRKWNSCRVDSTKASASWQRRKLAALDWKFPSNRKLNGNEKCTRSNFPACQRFSILATFLISGDEVSQLNIYLVEWSSFSLGSSCVANVNKKSYAVWVEPQMMEPLKR